MSATEHAMSQRRPRAESVGLQMQDFPLDLKRAVVKIAGDSNMNDAAVSILAKHYGVDFEPSMYHSPIEPGESTTFWLKMPRELRRRIKADAAERETTAKARVIDVLRSSRPVKRALKES